MGRIPGISRRAFVGAAATSLWQSRYLATGGLGLSLTHAVRSDTAAISSAHIYLPFTGGDTAPDQTPNAGSFGTSNYSIGGTTSAIWKHPGNLTPVGDNYISLSNSQWRSFARLDNLAGGIYYSFSITPRAFQATGTQSIISFSPYQTGNGGWEIYATASRRLVAHYRPGNASKANFTASSNTLALNQEHRVSAYIDTLNRQLSLYVDGEETITKWMTYEALASTSTNLDGKLFTNSAWNPASFLGLNNAEISISNLLIARVDRDISGDVPKLAGAWSRAATDLPQEYQIYL